MCIRDRDKAGDTGDYGDRGTEEDKEFVPEGERYDIILSLIHISIGEECILEP